MIEFCTSLLHWAVSSTVVEVWWGVTMWWLLSVCAIQCGDSELVNHKIYIFTPITLCAKIAVFQIDILTANLYRNSHYTVFKFHFQHSKLLVKGLRNGSNLILIALWFPSEWIHFFFLASLSTSRPFLPLESDQSLWNVCIYGMCVPGCISISVSGFYQISAIVCRFPTRLPHMIRLLAPGKFVCLYPELLWGCC